MLDVNNPNLGRLPNGQLAGRAGGFGLGGAGLTGAISFASRLGIIMT